MATINDVVSNLKNAVTNISALVTALKGSFPQITGTASSATGGSAPLPPNPSGFISTTLQDGTPIRIPFYSPMGGGPGGFVSSVGLALPSGIFSVSGSPVTSSGTLTGSLNSQTANQFFAAPDGSNGTPAFRTIAIHDLFGGSGASNSTFLRGDGTWNPPPTQSQNWTYINTVSVSGGTLTDTSDFGGSYRSFILVFKNIIPSNTGVSLSLQAHSGGSFQNTSYLCALQGSNSAGAYQGAATSTTGILLVSTTTNSINNADPGFSGQITVSGLSSTSIKKHWFGHGSFFNTVPGVNEVNYSGFWNGGNGAIDGFQLTPSAGTLTSGSVDIYGIT